MFHEDARRSVDEALDCTAERFKRRLAEELATLRVEMHTDLVNGLAGVREELRNGQAALRDEIRIARGDLLSWSFRLWTGSSCSLSRCWYS